MASLSLNSSLCLIPKSLILDIIFLKSLSLSTGHKNLTFSSNILWASKICVNMRCSVSNPEISGNAAYSLPSSFRSSPSSYCSLPSSYNSRAASISSRIYWSVISSISRPYIRLATYLILCFFLKCVTWISSLIIWVRSYISWFFSVYMRSFATVSCSPSSIS